MKASRVRKIIQEARVVVLPTREEIAARAHTLYVERAAGAGGALDDWLQAERELLEESLRDAVAPSPFGVRHITTHDLASK